MRIAIIAAMEEEVHYLKQHITNHEVYTFQGYVYHIGEINHHKVVLAQSGIGKVNAALSLALLLEHFKVQAVINTGTAGAIDQNFSVGDIVIAPQVVYHDVDACAFGYKYGQIPQMPATYECNEIMFQKFLTILHSLGYPYHVGVIATGDQFINDPIKFAAVLDKIPEIKAVDMEAAALTQVCHQYQIPCIVVRAISDVVSKTSHISFQTYIDIAAKNFSNVILAYLK